MVFLDKLSVAMKEAEGKDEVKIDLSDFEEEDAIISESFERFLHHGRFDLPTHAPGSKFTDLTLISREDLASLIRIIAKLGLQKIFDVLAALENPKIAPFSNTVPFVLAQTAKLFKKKTSELILNFLKDPEQFIVFVRFSVETRPFITDDFLVGIVDLWYENYGKTDTGNTIQGWRAAYECNPEIFIPALRGQRARNPESQVEGIMKMIRLQVSS